MDKLIAIIGKSGTGKDTLMNALLAHLPIIKKITPYTTRPMREGETNGKDYNFVAEAEMRELIRTGKAVEKREYQTVHGTWHYFTCLPKEQNHTMPELYAYIATPAVLPALKGYFGAKNVLILELRLDDKIRLERAIARESLEKKPSYNEICRRFLADSADFEWIDYAGSPHFRLDCQSPPEAILEAASNHIMSFI